MCSSCVGKAHKSPRNKFAPKNSITQALNLQINIYTLLYSKYNTCNILSHL